MTLDQIRALAKQAGYQLVPIEPTIKMMPASAIAQDEATTPTDAELLVKGWAIGHYTATCGRCSKMHDFTDKRSSVCRDCASDLVAKDKAQLRSLRVN